MIEQPFVSIVLPTYRREKVLCETIEQLLNQDYPNYEVIVVDQSPNHETTTINYLHNSPIKYFQLKHPSLPAARNFGVNAAQGEIILFVDDDVVVERSWINSHVINFTDPKIGGVSGRVIEDGQPIVDTKKVLRVTIWGQVIGNRTTTQKTKVEWASGGNSSFRKDLIIEAGCFDENFGGNAIFEDVDFSFRLRKLGYDIIFDPNAKIYHLKAFEGGCETRTLDQKNYYYWFIRNKTLFFTKNFPAIYWPLLWLANIYRALLVSVNNRDISIFASLIKSMYVGYQLSKEYKTH